MDKKILEIEDNVYELDASLEKVRVLMQDINLFYEYIPETDMDKIILDYDRHRIKTNAVIDYINRACTIIEQLQKNMIDVINQGSI